MLFFSWSCLLIICLAFCFFRLFFRLFLLPFFSLCSSFSFVFTTVLAGLPFLYLLLLPLWRVQAVAILFPVSPCGIPFFFPFFPFSFFLRFTCCTRSHFREMIDEFREDSVEPNRRCSVSSSENRVSSSNSNASNSGDSRQLSQPRLQQPWTNWGPTIQSGSITPCFRGGFLYRLYDEATHIWAFYNDTFTFEMHCSFTFEKSIPVKVLTPRVKVESLPSGEKKYSIVIFPMETVEVMQATRGRNKAQFDGKPLSKEYLAREMEEVVAEIQQCERRLREFTCSNKAAEVLRVCKEKRLAFIDPEFPPTPVSFEQSSSLASTPFSTTTSICGSAAPKPSTWRRPEDYLPPNWRDQLRLFRNPIVPSVVQRGDLGDSWVISAIAALCENPTYVRDMFRHPENAKETRVEEALGARRVMLNKDGLWQSMILDTYLPINGKQQRFARCANDFCEMWVSYLEKAYAKRNRSYGNIVCGDPLLALRDFTGFPTTRLDAKFRACRHDETASAALFDRLSADCEAGHQILLSTPLSGESAMSTTELRKQGILVGYAYTVLEMVQVNPLTRLLRVRNPWASCADWKGLWGVNSPQWDRCPEAAAAFPVHDGADGSVVFSWEEVLVYFIGCGVVFNHFDYADYRIPSRFIGANAQVCLEVSVTEPTQLTFILSQEDKRTRQETDSALEYAPLVLSIAAREEGSGDGKPMSPLARSPTTTHKNGAPSSSHSGVHAVGMGGPVEQRPPGLSRFQSVVNSTADAENPTRGLVFLQGRDVSVVHTFLPERSPYLVVPCRLVRDGDVEELPFVLGVLSQLPFTAFGQAHVRLRRLSHRSLYYGGATSFVDETEEVKTRFQVKRSAASVVMRKGSLLNPEE